MASKRSKAKSILKRVRRTRKRERALKELKSSYEREAVRDPPVRQLKIEDVEVSGGGSADGWSTATSDQSGSDWSDNASSVEHWWDKPKEKPKAPPPDPPRKPGPGERERNRNPGAREPDHQRWLDEVKGLVFTEIPISLNFRIKESEKRRIISLKRFSVKDRKIIPFGDSSTVPHRFSLEAHNARVDLYRTLVRLADDVAYFRLSPEVLGSLIGMAKELKATIRQSVVETLQVDRLLKRLGFLLRISGVSSWVGSTQTLPSELRMRQSSKEPKANTYTFGS